MTGIVLAAVALLIAGLAVHLGNRVEPVSSPLPPIDEDEHWASVEAVITDREPQQSWRAEL